MEQFGNILTFLWHFAVVWQNKPGLVPPSLRREKGLFHLPEFIFLASKLVTRFRSRDKRYYKPRLNCLQESTNALSLVDTGE